jgi:dihydrofolate reductase
MRKVTFGVANSLDNFIARSDHSFDWILWGEEAAAYMSDYWKTIDTIILGRKTYEVALGSSRKGKNPYAGMKTYVCSRTMKGKTGEDVEIISEDAGAFVRKLKRKRGKDICVMGGGELANSLLEADVIDEIGLNIHPVLLGSGIPLFLPMKRQVNLELRECKPFKNGCVLVLYDVKHRGGRSRK